jgi:hypothetical protein
LGYRLKPPNENGTGQVNQDAGPLPTAPAETTEELGERILDRAYARAAAKFGVPSSNGTSEVNGTSLGAAGETAD